MLNAVIMAGGSGTRFWPKSRKQEPKQLLSIASKTTLIEETIHRLEGTIKPENIYVITNKTQEAMMRSKLLQTRTHKGASHPASTQDVWQIPAENIIAEPVGRDTAACIALAASILHKKDPEGEMVVLPADHVIRQRADFIECVLVARDVAVHNKSLVTFGIKPAGPATQFGYIHRGKKRGAIRGVNYFAVQSFTEKPDLQTARNFISSGEYYWNSGVFVWQNATILEAVKQFLPAHYEACKKIADAYKTSKWEIVFENEYTKLPSISIDYAILEKHPRIDLIEGYYFWDDVGSWGALARLYPADKEGNIVLGQHYGLNTHNCIVFGKDNHLITTIDVENLVIVVTDDATLICHRDSVDDVKKLVQQLDGHQKYKGYL